MTLFDSTALDTMRKLPLFLIVKNFESVYTFTTDYNAKLAGWKSADHVVGQTDFDIPSDISKCAEQFIQLDQQTITSKDKVYSISIQNFTIGQRMFLGERTPLFDENNNVTSIIISGSDLTDTKLCNACLLLYQRDKKLINFSVSGITYCLNNELISTSLTKRQQEILFFLVRGKTTKKIASILQLSSRTVEEHLDMIKNKFDCYSKPQLIEKALASGYLNFIPKHLFNNIEKIALD